MTIVLDLFSPYMGGPSNVNTFDCPNFTRTLGCANYEEGVCEYESAAFAPVVAAKKLGLPVDIFLLPQ